MLDSPPLYVLRAECPQEIDGYEASSDVFEETDDSSEQVATTVSIGSGAGRPVPDSSKSDTSEPSRDEVQLHGYDLARRLQALSVVAPPKNGMSKVPRHKVSDTSAPSRVKSPAPFSRPR